MKKMTGEEFEELINKDPSWCLNLKENLEVTTYANLVYSKITHLSPLITFSGRDKFGWSADFERCKNLEVATGTFEGAVSFSDSNIQKIENIKVNAHSENGYSATFLLCNLKVATGTFSGFVQFSDTGIETIKDLIIRDSDLDNEKARFFHCPIQYVPEEYRSKQFKFNLGVVENSIIKDKIKEAINKIKSEANNIEL